jgi:hypothetical protein
MTVHLGLVSARSEDSHSNETDFDKGYKRGIETGKQIGKRDGFRDGQRYTKSLDLTRTALDDLRNYFVEERQIVDDFIFSQASLICSRIMGLGEYTHYQNCYVDLIMIEREIAQMCKEHPILEKLFSVAGKSSVRSSTLPLGNASGPSMKIP